MKLTDIQKLYVNAGLGKIEYIVKDQQWLRWKMKPTQFADAKNTPKTDYAPKAKDEPTSTN